MTIIFMGKGGSGHGGTVSMTLSIIVLSHDPHGIYS